MPLFRDVAAETGLNFRHFIGATGQYYMPEMLSSGVGLLDYDNDGDLDIYFVQGTLLDPSKKLSDSLLPPPAGWKPGNRLFRSMLSETGKLSFVDVTEQAGVGNVGYGMGVAVGDYDNDGYADMFVTNFGHTVLYHNNGKGAFSDVTRQAGVDLGGWTTSASWVDYDRDGLLDLFVVSYIDFNIRINKPCYSGTGEIDYCSPLAYHPLSSHLFHNKGNGKFEDVTSRAGVGKAGNGLGVACDDFNGDGLIDIYVANDAAANYLWLNQGNGTFKEGALAAGVAYNADGSPQAGMGIAVGDYDNDSHDDILVGNLTGEGCVLYHNDGKGIFYDTAAEVGLLQPTFPFTTYGVAWLDYDNDGWLDVFMANGSMTVMESERGDQFPFKQKKLLFHNEDRGKHFRDTSKLAGPEFAIPEVGRGAAFGDIDNDGALDVVVTNSNGPPRLLMNQARAHAGNYWIEIRLESPGGYRFGIGAHVAILRPGQPPLWRHAHTDGSIMSASDPRLHFGLGNIGSIQSVLVIWPDGLRESFQGLSPDRLVTLRRGAGVAGVPGVGHASSPAR